MRAADLPLASSTPANPTSIPNLRDSPEDQAAAECSTERNKALAVKRSDALRNKDTATAQVLVTDGWVILGTGSKFAEGPQARKQRKAYIDVRWGIPRWGLGMTFLPRTIELSAAIARTESRGLTTKNRQ